MLGFDGLPPSFQFHGNTGGVARGGGGFKRIMIQSSHRYGIFAPSPNLSESSLPGWAPAPDPLLKVVWGGAKFV